MQKSDDERRPVLCSVRRRGGQRRWGIGEASDPYTMSQTGVLTLRVLTHPIVPPRYPPRLDVSEPHARMH